MPSYFFDAIINGDMLRDDEGVQLATTDEARREAVRTLYAMASEASLVQAGPMNASMRVRDEHGNLLLKLDITTTVTSVERAVRFKT